MRVVGTWGMLLVLLIGAMASAGPLVPVINVGSHDLLPNTPHQPIQVYVTSGVGAPDVSAVDFNMQIDKGYPYGDLSVPGPIFDQSQPIDLVTGTIFAADNSGQFDTAAGPPPLDPPAKQNLMWGILTSAAGHYVPANGLLATVYVDTTGYSSGTWPLAMSTTLNGPTMFHDGLGNADITPQITDGSINIVPEPSTFCLLSMAVTGVLACAWRRGRRAA
jgi:hypothetical protein